MATTRSAKTPLGGPSLSVAFAEWVAEWVVLLPARSDLVGRLPFASLFVFMILIRAPYRRFLSRLSFCTLHLRRSPHHQTNFFSHLKLKTNNEEPLPHFSTPTEH